MEHWSIFQKIASIFVNWGNVINFVIFTKNYWIQCGRWNLLLESLSSPRAESARAFTGRRNSHSEKGEDFLSRQPNFFTETAVTPEWKVEKTIPRWEMNRHSEDYKWVID